MTVTAFDIAKQWPILYIAYIDESIGLGCFTNQIIQRIILILPNGNVTSVIRALRDIKMHKQITWHYGDHYWNARPTEPNPN